MTVKTATGLRETQELLSYQHAFHAGNRADLHKHGTLVWLLTRLTQKDKPASYVDVFAGRGLYDLAGETAHKTGEAAAGITRVFGRVWPEEVTPWKTLLQSLNPQGGLRFYAGSPLLASKLLRPEDRLYLCELHTNEYSKLHYLFKDDSRSNLHHRHAHEALAALLPPTPRRGLVLIDPSYEVKAEYDQIAKLLVMALTKWPAGSFLLWYPLLEEGFHQTLLRQLAAQPVPQLISEWRWRETWHEDSHDLPKKGMLGSGLLLLNPPWQAERFLHAWQSTLCEWFPGSRAQLESRHVEA